MKLPYDVNNNPVQLLARRPASAQAASVSTIGQFFAFDEGTNAFTLHALNGDVLAMTGPADMVSGAAVHFYMQGLAYTEAKAAGAEGIWIKAVEGSVDIRLSELG